jgi:hypothetical protein
MSYDSRKKGLLFAKYADEIGGACDTREEGKKYELQNFYTDRSDGKSSLRLKVKIYLKGIVCGNVDWICLPG